MLKKQLRLKLEVQEGNNFYIFAEIIVCTFCEQHSLLNYDISHNANRHTFVLKNGDLLSGSIQSILTLKNQ